MRRVFAVMILALGIGLAAGPAVMLATGGADNVAAHRGHSVTAGEPYRPVSPVDPQPQPQPIWIIRIPI